MEGILYNHSREESKFFFAHQAVYEIELASCQVGLSWAGGFFRRLVEKAISPEIRTEV